MRTRPSPKNWADSPAVEEPPKKRGRPTRNSIKKEVVTVDEEEETEAEATESRRRSISLNTVLKTNLKVRSDLFEYCAPPEILKT